MRIIFSPHHGARRLKDAQRKLKDHAFSFVAYREAHRTAWFKMKERGDAMTLDNKSVRITRRLFTTATLRLVQRAEDDLRGISMLEAETFGDARFNFSFRDAINAGGLCDYIVMAVFVDPNRRLNFRGNRKR